MRTVSVHTSDVRFPAAPDLYGLFFEDINRSGDGGLYPELLRNRSFEDSILPDRCKFLPNGLDFTTPRGWKDQFNNGEGLRRWDPDREETPIPAWYARKASMELDFCDVLNSNRRASLTVTFQAGGSIHNTGYRGVPVSEGARLNGYLILKTDSPCTLTLSLASKDLGQVYAACDLFVSPAAAADAPQSGACGSSSPAATADAPQPGGCAASASAPGLGNGYRKYDFTLIPSGTDYDAVFVISSAQEARVKLGYSSLMPADTFKGHGLRKDLAQLLEGTSSRFLRFPGGCIVEGFTKETAMRFPNTIGPVWERPSHNLMWHYRTSNGLGFHEYLQLCEDLELEPLYVINCGLTCQGRREELFEGEELDVLLQEACDAIDYATAPADSPMGALRAAAGHPEPFGMTYVEIGNENLGQEYLDRYAIFYDALKARYPKIKFIANIHVEENGLPADIVDEHYYNTPEFFARQVSMFDSYDRRGPEIFVGEYAVTNGTDVGNLRSAIAETIFLLGIENNQDIVTLTAYAPLFNHVHYTSWTPDLIAFDNHRSYGIPFYYALSMLAENHGGEVVRTAVDSPVSHEKTVGLTGIVANGPGVFLRNMTCNGKPVSPSHNIVSSLKQQADGAWEVWETDNSELMRSPGLSVKEVLQEVKTYVTFGEEETASTVFETELYLTDPSVKTSVAFWIHNNTMLHNQDETRAGEDKLWTPIYTNRYVWSLDNGSSYIDAITRSRYSWHGPKQETPQLVYGRWMKIRVEAEHDRIRCYIDGALVTDQPTPGFPILAASACQKADSEKETGTILVKLANISEFCEPVTITLDRDVLPDYTCTVLTGDSPKAENSFENPFAVSPVTTAASGASREFVYQAPPFSFSILKLKW